MDFVMNAVSSFIAQKWNHLQSLDENLDKLKRKIEELNCRKEDVESKIKAELQAGKRPKKEVQLWLANVEQINSDKKGIENKVEKGRFLERASLGEHIAEKIQEIDVLLQKGIFIHALVVDSIPGEREDDEVCECWRNGDLTKNAVYGIGGVGNTIITNSFHNINSIHL